MISFVVGIIPVIVAAATVYLIQHRNTKGNEFQLYRDYYSYSGSGRTITLGMFSGKAGAEEALAEYKTTMTTDGLTFGTEKVVVNTFGGRDGNIVYEWKRNNAEDSCVFFFTRKEDLNGIISKLEETSNKGNEGEFKAYEINRIITENGGG